MRRPKFSSCFLLCRDKKNLKGGLFVGSGGCLQLVAARPVPVFVVFFYGPFWEKCEKSSLKAFRLCEIWGGLRAGKCEMSLA